VIIVRVYGGLGNQLFQINFGNFLHEKFNQDVHFDFSFFKTKGKRKPLVRSILKEINQPPKNITKRFIKFNSFRLNQLYNKIFNKNYFTEFDPKIQIDENQNYFFDGYWQDQKFLTKDSIQFQKVKFSKTTKDYLDQIQASKKSISIHIRRTDYLTKKNIKIFRILDQDYYLKAINLISKESNANFKIFVFSDNIKWAEKNLKFDLETTYIQNTDELEDFNLMMNCQHNILANSTFSWWAAYLKKNKRGLIIGPKIWYNNQSFEKNIKLKNWTWI
jgi:hypothetical protein